MALYAGKIWVRILADVVLLGSIFWAPFWLTLILAVLFFFYFENFYEFLFVALLIDLLYGVPEARYGGFVFVTFLSGIVLFFILALAKKRLLIFDK